MAMATLGASTSRSHCGPAPFNVMNYGAVGDGVADDSQAFLKAWAAVCRAPSNNPTLQVPEGKTFLLNPTNFSGPCKSSNIHVQIDGDLVAPKDPSIWEGLDLEFWLTFSGVDGFVVDGNGQIDGQGYEWWKYCQDKDCEKPTALKFKRCSNFRVSGLRHLNSQKNHISILSCENASLSYLQLSAPETSPNTDGFDISNSKNIQILDSIVATGDDCVAINTGCSQISIIGMTCGPGHGISVGSLGKNRTTAEVEEIYVKNCTLKATQNGVRIKTWQGGSGFARKISFQDIKFIAIDNPIIIDQFYCPHETCRNQTDAVQISDISYIGIHGTSIKEDAIALDCSQTYGCNNIFLNHIQITSTEENNKTYSSCSNAHGNFDDVIPSMDCLTH